MTVKKGDRVLPGTIIAEVPETRAIIHKAVSYTHLAEGEIPKVPGAPMAVLPKAEGPAEENTDHHLWKWY